MCRLGLVLLLFVLFAEAAGSRAEHDEVPWPAPSSTTRRLEPLAKPDPAGTTVSGLSSGAFFAHQFHVAYSSLVEGAGLIAGGPYRCIEIIRNPYSPFWPVPLDRFSAATVACTRYLGSRYFGLRPAGPEASNSLRLIREAWAQGAIDDPAHLADDRVWLFHGGHDRTVPRGVMEALAEVYRGLGVHGSRLHADWESSDRPAEHGMPVAAFTGRSAFRLPACDEHAPPFIIECGFDAAELLLRHLFPEGLEPASDDPHGDGTLVDFDQSEFLSEEKETVGLARVGYAYVPRSCAEAACRLHIAFHGCRQSVKHVHDDFVRDAGYNRWAASNRILVLYPQASASPANPNGCWDFWGYSGSDYYARGGQQMRAVRAMADRLLARRPEPPSR